MRAEERIVKSHMRLRTTALITTIILRRFGLYRTKSFIKLAVLRRA